MSHVIAKNYFLSIGQRAPKHSKFKGKITPGSIFGYNGLFDYTNRVDANHERISEELEQSFFNYTSREGANVAPSFLEDDEIIYTNKGLLGKEERDKFKEECKLFFTEKNQCLWVSIFSFKDYDITNQMHLRDITDYGKLIEKILPDFLKEIGLDQENIMWWANVHSNTEHPHCHFHFFDKRNERTRGKFTEKQMNHFKYLIEKETLNYQKKGELFKENYQNIVFEKNEMKKSVLSEVKNIEFKSLLKIEEFFEKLPSSGRLQVNSIHMKPYRDELYSLVDELLKREGIQNKVIDFKEKCHELQSLISQSAGNQQYNVERTEMEKLKQTIANLILSERKNFHKSFEANVDSMINIDDKNINSKFPSFTTYSDKENINDIEIRKNSSSIERKEPRLYIKDNETFSHNLFHRSRGAVGKKIQELEEEIARYLGLDKGGD